MPIQLEFHHESLGVIYRCKGNLNAQHFSGARNQLLDAPDRIRNVKYVIVDAVSMVPQYVSPGEMDRIVWQDRQIASFVAQGLLVAFVAKTRSVLGFARMWEAFIEGIDWETKVVPTIEEAQDWVQVRVKDKFGLEISWLLPTRTHKSHEDTSQPLRELHSNGDGAP
jgi:hypothetical protein